MISFSLLSSETCAEILQNVISKCENCDSEYVSNILDELSSEEDGCEYAITATEGCLLIRVYDGEYFFLYPEPISDSYDIFAAIDAMRLYAIREEIPLVICEVPYDDVENVSALFANAEISEEDEDGEIFTVRALSEIMLREAMPSVKGEKLELVPLSLSDERAYAELCRDSDTNKYWGYDFSEDNSDPEDSFFVESALCELSRGVALSYAVKLDGEFVGEAMLYAFDLLGGSECAVRLLPKYRGRGLSVECLELLQAAAKDIGLKRLCATVDNRNIPSIRLFERVFNKLEKDKEKTRFVREM